ncbi:MAG: Na+/H+ antiporter NhaC family protein [Phycisphaerae bacterium]
MTRLVQRRAGWRILAAVVAFGVLAAVSLAATPTDAAPVVATQSAAAPAVATQSAPAPATMPAGPGGFYGIWVVVPPLVTIILAIWLRQVVPALAVGVLVAATMLAWYDVQPASVAGVAAVAVGGVTRATEGFLIGALADSQHMKIVVFTLLIGGMVGVIGANGGTPAIVHHVARWASSRQRGQVTVWLAGLIVFFDDYANAMIIGPSMRPICDRLRISRAKLAYIVDSTAAPVASIALIGTWIGAELSYIQDGLSELHDRPAFLVSMTAYQAFLRSIPYRFYPILALVMVVLVGALGRDFGPMRRAERDAQAAPEEGTTGGAAEVQPGRVWYALVPVAVLVCGTLALLVITGWPAGGLAAVQVPPETPRWIGVMAEILYECDSYNSILYGALAAVVVAAGISLVTRALSLARTVESAMAVMSRMLPTVVVLVLAWALSAAVQALQLGEVATDLLKQGGFAARWLPLLVFGTACVVSFATGTSWGTMGILCPVVVTIAAGLLGAVPAGEAEPLFYASVGAVLAGAVFGDHCSPISDTTVLSSLASECTLEKHVWTQMPYALVVAVVSTLSGEVLCRWLDWPAWGALLIGTAALAAIVLVIGRRPAPAHAG